ncbi:hypothetical protein [Hydrogenophaga sp. 5NK40-0174]|uniref:hypothetical protein n=1 Tax=Hydrogenophaga sp. 5NK40-0174 TaxID=3127649 RepID=UPI00333EB6A0
MKSAPSVQYPVGRSPFYGVVLVALAMVLLLAWGLWLSSTGTSAHVSEIAGAGFLAWAGWCWWAWRHWNGSLTGVLRWTVADESRVKPEAASTKAGGDWLWASSEGKTHVLDQVKVVVDLQGTVLVMLRSKRHGRMPTHIWLHRSSEPSRWLELRRALVAHAE